MKKLLLAAAAALMTVGAYAQYRPTFIISAGYQGATLKVGDSKDTKIASGARVGVDADFSLYDAGYMNISLRPGVHFSMKGSKLENGFKFGDLIDTKASATTHLYYIDVPILANVGFNAGEFGVFVNAGPYLGVGVGSSLTTTSSTATAMTDPKTTTDSKSTNLFGDNGAYNRFDWGIQVGGGVEYNRFLVGVGAQFGLQNINRVKEAAGVTLPATKNSAFFVTVGYRF